MIPEEVKSGGIAELKVSALIIPTFVSREPSVTLASVIATAFEVSPIQILAKNLRTKQGSATEVSCSGEIRGARNVLGSATN